MVLNVNGRNQNELVRRFTLAHEACHVLFDRHDLAALSRLDAHDDLYAYSDDTRGPHEVGATAFAIHLLAPKHLSEEVWTRVRGDIPGAMLAFGISFEAARAHLANYSLQPLGERIVGVPTPPSGEWKTAESSDPWVAGEIATSRLREALGVYVPHGQLRELAELYLGTLAA